MDARICSSNDCLIKANQTNSGTVSDANEQQIFKCHSCSNNYHIGCIPQDVATFDEQEFVCCNHATRDSAESTSDVLPDSGLLSALGSVQKKMFLRCAETNINGTACQYHQLWRE